MGLFVIDNKKWDTGKMQKLAKGFKCEYTVENIFTTDKRYIINNYDTVLYRTQKGNYFLTYCDGKYGKVLSEDEAKNILMHADLKKYEALFGELEEG